MSEMGDDFSALREHNRLQREASRERRSKWFEVLRAEGYSVRELTPYQFRVEEKLDIFPTRARWHDIRTNKRGSFHGQNLASFVRKQIPIQQPDMTVPSDAWKEWA